MSVLRVYLPSECDSAGVPLDWERCRGCGGDGKNPERDGSYGAACRICAGHGSLKAAALMHLRRRADTLEQVVDADPYVEEEFLTATGDDIVPCAARCADCGHPMSEGTWEGVEWGGLVGPPPGSQEWALDHLRRGDEPPAELTGGGFTFRVFYSPCDEGCRHGGVYRYRLGPAYPWSLPASAPKGSIGACVADPLDSFTEFEASWRPVDVRCLGWPHDLRPERLAVLCLRCWAARDNPGAPA